MDIIDKNNGVATEIKHIDITNLDETSLHDIRKIVRSDVVTILKKQSTQPAYFTNFVSKIGPIGNFKQLLWDPTTGELCNNTQNLHDPLMWSNPETYPVQRVTGKKINGKDSGIFGTGVLDWHANLNGLRRADGVALQGYKDCEGTSTTWLNMAKAYEQMPDDLKQRCANVFCSYTYSPETWAAGLSKKQKEAMLKNPSSYNMWLVQKNISGRHGLYFYTNNNCKIHSEDTELYNDLYDYVFCDKFMYTHYYDIGDIVLSDQLLSLHKRDQNDPNILSKRILHRLTFSLSNFGDPTYLEKYNNGL